jgi:hypothetical protein
MPHHNKTTISGIVAIIRSKSDESTAETGNAIRGQLIFVTRFVFEVRLTVANLMALTKNAHGRAFTDIDAKLSGVISVPVIRDIATLMSMPAPTMIAGMSTAHSRPIADCLYFILISRDVSTNNRSRRTWAVLGILRCATLVTVVCSTLRYPRWYSSSAVVLSLKSSSATDVETSLYSSILICIILRFQSTYRSLPVLGRCSRMLLNTRGTRSSISLLVPAVFQDQSQDNVRHVR